MWWNLSVWRLLCVAKLRLWPISRLCRLCLIAAWLLCGLSWLCLIAALLLCWLCRLSLICVVGRLVRLRWRALGVAIWGLLLLGGNRGNCWLYIRIVRRLLRDVVVCYASRRCLGQWGRDNVVLLFMFHGRSICRAVMAVGTFGLLLKVSLSANGAFNNFVFDFRTA